ncbi:MAG TPA: hypothetical protein VGH48_09215 [Caldimonas sp.]
MTPAEIDRVFGRGRLRMTTAEHVEVYREEARGDEERRYTKRFLATASGDFRAWTEREWRLLDRLGTRGDAAVAKAVRFFPADESGMARLQTRDAGATVDQWAALVPLQRAAPVLPYVFGDCANWWALARQCLIALDPLHALGFVHLDFKADNVCIPWKPAQAARPAPGQPLAPDFDALALIDVAFSLLPGIDLPGPLPLAREPGYEYQSPRLLDALAEGRRGNLAPTIELDWRCDLFSVAAMLWRYLPELDDAAGTGWTSQRHASATSFVRQLLHVHAEPLPAARPHRALIGQAALHLAEPQLAAALQLGSAFDPERTWPHGAEAMPLTRVVPTGSAAGAAAATRSARAARAARAERREPMVAEPIDSTRVPLVDVPLDTPFDGPLDRTLDLPLDVSLDALVAEAMATPIVGPGVAPTAPATPSALTAAICGSAPAAEAAPMPPRKAIAAPIAAAPATAEAQLTPPTPTLAPAGTAAPPALVSAPSAAPTIASVHATTAAISAAASAATQATATQTPAPKPPLRVVPAAPAGEAAPRQPPAGAGLPLRPPSTPVPILAAAGVGALLVALAAWWALDGRAMFDRMAQRSAAPAASASLGVSTTPATSTAPPSAGEDSAAAPPALAPATEAAAEPDTAPTFASTPTVAASTAEAASAVAATPAEAASAVAAATPAEASASRADAGPPAAPAGEFESIAADWMNTLVPRIAKSAERQLAPALGAAARSPELRRRSEIRAAVEKARASTAAAPGVAVRADKASTLNEAARVAYWRDNNVAEAVRLQTQAFGANPIDAEVAGNLAALRLKETPPQAEAARQLALHALTLKDERFPTGRIDDWTTLAIANGLTGRDKDARNAWFVSMALTSDPQHQCNAAVRAQATYGDRLRPSVQPMLQRARSSAAYGRCDAPQSSPTSKPAGKNVKSKSTQKPRRPIP